MRHQYVKCDLHEFHKLRTKLKDQYDEKTFLNHVPNSLGGKPYPQFTIKTEDGKITYWTDKRCL